MNYVLDAAIILITFVVFGIIHSFLASSKFKRKIKKKFGSLIAFYRLFYNLFSFILLILLFIFIPKPALVIYKLPPTFDIIILFIQLIAIAGLIWSIKYFSAGEFLGIAQIIRWAKNSYDDELDEKLTLRIEGPYKFSRHPVYFFAIIFLTAQSAMDLFYLTVLICFILYFYIGSYYEEKKLIGQFGNKYITYQKSVPRIVPHIFSKKFY